MEEDAALLESDDDEQEAKRPKNIRQAVTEVYEKKVEQTRKQRVADGTLKPRAEVDYIVSEGRSQVPEALTKVPEPLTREKAPTLKVQDLIPEEIKADGCEELGTDTFKASKVEFLVMSKKIGEADAEWEIPDAKAFEEAMSQALDAYLKGDPDRLDALEYSTLGWETGVGLVAFRADKEELMEEFRAAMRKAEWMGNGFETFPKKILLTRFALSIYFNSAFKAFSPEMLLYWLKRYNSTLAGSLTVVSIKAYPPGHKREGARIVAFEGDSQFLDALYRHHKDFPFRIKFGGNLYIRGGERIDAADPRGVPSKGPRMARAAIQRFLAGSKESIVEERMKNIEEGAKASEVFDIYPPYMSRLGLRCKFHWQTDRGTGGYISYTSGSKHTRTRIRINFVNFINFTNFIEKYVVKPTCSGRWTEAANYLMYNSAIGLPNWNLIWKLNEMIYQRNPRQFVTLIKFTSFSSLQVRHSNAKVGLDIRKIWGKGVFIRQGNCKLIIIIYYEISTFRRSLELLRSNIRLEYQIVKDRGSHRSPGYKSDRRNERLRRFSTECGYRSGCKAYITSTKNTLLRFCIARTKVSKILSTPISIDPLPLRTCLVSNVTRFLYHLNCISGNFSCIAYNFSHSLRDMQINVGQLPWSRVLLCVKLALWRLAVFTIEILTHNDAK